MPMVGEGGDEPGGSLWLYGSNMDNARTVNWDRLRTARSRDLRRQDWDDVAFCEEQDSWSPPSLKYGSDIPTNSQLADRVDRDHTSPNNGIFLKLTPAFELEY